MINALLILYIALNLLATGYIFELMIKTEEYAWFVRLYNELRIKYNVIGALIPTATVFIFFIPATIITYLPLVTICIIGGIIVYGEMLWNKLFKRKDYDEED